MTTTDTATRLLLGALWVDAFSANPWIGDGGLRGEKLLEGLAEVGGFAGSSVAVAGLKGPVDGAENEGACGVRLPTLIGGEPGFDLWPSPQRVPGGVSGGSGKSAGASLAIDEFIDGLSGATGPLGVVFGRPDQFIGVDVHHLEAVDGLDVGDGREDGVEKEEGASRSKAAKVE